MKLKLLILFILISLKGYSQLEPILYTEIDFNEKQADTISLKLDTILILGKGASVARIFLDDLTNKLIKELNKEKIVASYVYLGNNSDEVKGKFKLIDKQKYKGILFVSPTDTATFDTKYSTSPSTAQGSTNSSRITYQQTFKFQFYDVGKGMKVFWSALIDIDCDPSKKYAANRVSSKLLARFKKNKYIQ